MGIGSKEPIPIFRCAWWARTHRPEEPKRAYEIGRPHTGVRGTRGKVRSPESHSHHVGETSLHSKFPIALRLGILRPASLLSAFSPRSLWASVPCSGNCIDNLLQNYSGESSQTRRIHSFMCALIFWYLHEKIFNLP